MTDVSKDNTARLALIGLFVVAVAFFVYVRQQMKQEQEMMVYTQKQVELLKAIVEKEAKK